jgi:hypothetical protein
VRRIAMKQITTLLIFVCILLAGGIGFYVGSKSQSHFIPVKIESPLGYSVVLVFESQTGELAGKYWHLGKKEQ